MISEKVLIFQDLEEKQEFYEQAKKATEQNDISTANFEASFYERATFDLLIHFLPHYPYEIKIPIRISIEKGQTSDCFIVCCEEFNKFGLGHTKEEAIEDLENNIVDDYLILNDTCVDNLTNDAKDLLQKYRAHISLS